MIIARLTEGLGNQLFQYAAARCVSELNHKDLKLDISWYKRNHQRAYRLHHFNIQENLLTPKEFAHLPKNRHSAYFSAIIDSKKKMTFFTDNHFYFDAGVFKIQGNLWLRGFWQSEKYFKDIENIIRHEFVIKTTPDAQNMKTIERIQASDNAVCIHIRRTDYLHGKSIYYHCPLSYYHQAIEILTREIKNPHFFIFSDDIQWAKENLNLEYPSVYIDHNGPEKDYEDLRLMSLCKHHIIANSSFSWWGAWLATHENQKVFAPRQWFTDPKFNTKDLIPESWIKL